MARENRIIIDEEARTNMLSLVKEIRALVEARFKETGQAVAVMVMGPTQQVVAHMTAAFNATALGNGVLHTELFPEGMVQWVYPDEEYMRKLAEGKGDPG